METTNITYSQRLKNAIALVKETEFRFFKKNNLQYYLVFSKDGNEMWFEYMNNNHQLQIELSGRNDAIGNTKKYVLQELKKELAYSVD